MLKEIVIQCDQCQKDNCKTVKLRKPSDFTNPDKATMLSQYWCNHCGEPQAVRYQFVEGKNEEIGLIVKTRIKPSSLFIPKKASTGITIRPRSRGARR